MNSPDSIAAFVPRFAAAVLLTAVAFTGGGCVQSERLAVFEDYPQIEKYEEVDLLQVPDELQPGLPAEPAVEMPADGILQLSVEQAMVLALRHNRDLRVRQYNPIITGAFEQIERGNYDPELFGELSYSEEQASETARATGTQFSVESTETGGVAGIRQQLPTGTAIAATVEQERSVSNRAPEQQDARVGLTVTQALLRGFGPAVNLVGVRQAELDTAASRYELRGFTEALLAETETAYWHYVLAEQEIAIFERSQTIARQQLDKIRQRIEVGTLPQVESAAARAEVARRD